MKMNQLTKELCALVMSLCGIKEVDDFIKRNKFTSQETIRFKFDLSIFNIFLTTWVINLFVNEEKAKQIIDPLFKIYMDLYKHFKSNSSNYYEFRKSIIKIGDIVKRESELKLLETIMKSSLPPNVAGKDIDIKDFTTNWRTLAGMLYNIRQAGYREAIENQGNLGPIFSLAREFSRHFTGNENDEENGWLVIELSLLFTLFNKILIDFCKFNLA